jgi:hypothetical protein
MSKKQIQLPGLERKKLPAIDTAAEHYVKMRDTRMKWTEKEHEAKEQLVAEMVKAQITSYKDEDVNPPLVVMIIDGKMNVKVEDEPDDTPTKRGSKGKRKALPEPEESEMAKVTREARETGDPNGEAKTDA